ncbi:hypothetical protein [Commensalibacter oyaizuii]|uniref:Uncharacterized protein n=1 Tax=Commensalibacter oyaizuii TaxID=3043873 RepID=A0ABT6Q3N7_9PROT|nr:hypothetical protein [Commensalibacter sp. TBRC 16381]MDI2091630.1 hypothetical protein [Commensalibacter sp. TBRC 16381]
MHTNIHFGYSIGQQQSLYKIDASRIAFTLSKDLSTINDMFNECFEEVARMVDDFDEPKQKRLKQLRQRVEFLSQYIQEKTDEFYDISQQIVKL